MTRIIYKINDGWGEHVGIGGREDGSIAIELTAPAPSFVTVGEAVRELKDGRAVFPLSEITDGDHTPLLSGAVCAVLEPIRKRGRTVTLLPTPDETVRRLLKRAASLERRLEVAEGSIRTLAEKIEKTTIF